MCICIIIALIVSLLLVVCLIDELKAIRLYKFQDELEKIKNECFDENEAFKKELEEIKNKINKKNEEEGEKND